MGSKTKGVVFGILFLFVILSIPLVVAQPPFQQDIVISGYEIQIPFQGNIRANQDYTFFFHVFNSSDGLPLIDTEVGCEFNLHNSSSSVIVSNLDLDFDSSTKAFSIEVKGGNFTVIGDYSYVVHCNSTSLGGVESIGFMVTATGQEQTEAQSILILGLLILLLFISGALLYCGKETKFMPFRIFLISLGVLFLMVSIGVSVNIIKQLVVDSVVFSGTFVNLYRLSLIFVSMGGIGLVLYIIVKAVQGFRKNRGYEED